MIQKPFDWELPMSSEESWGAKRLAVARAICPTVTDAVSARIEDLLNGDLSKRQLPTQELTSIARELLKAMVPPLKPEARE